MLSLTEFSNGELTGSDRFDSWLEAGARSLMPVTARCVPGVDLEVSLRVLTLQDVQLSRCGYSSLHVGRTTRLIRQSDPEAYQLNLFHEGRARISQCGRAAEFGAGQFALIDSSRPFQAMRSCSADPPSYLLQVPRRSLGVPPDVLSALVAVPFEAGRGIAALLSDWLHNLLARAHELGPEQAATLAAMTVDLFRALVADCAGETPSENPQWLLRMRVDRFIDRHLRDPGLTPDVVAAAHHVSLRRLQQLFAATGDSPAAWIRRRRLDRCRHDLTDPRLRHEHVHTIAARWGFTGQAHFSRLFHATYGMSPVECRGAARNAPEPCAEGQKSGDPP